MCLKERLNKATNGGDGGDLEDGEIFDDEDDTPVAPPPPTITGSSIIEDLKKKAGSPPLRKPLPPIRPQRKPKRLREDDRPFKSNKQRRRSDDSEKPKDRNEDDEMRELSPLRGDWERVHHRSGFGDDLLDEEDDELDGGRRGMRSFMNRRRGGRNGRGGRRGGGMNNRRDGGQICRFYLQGKCQRGGDCPYSHANQRKYELCKFYMMDCCAKKDRCPYLHSEFPCKYYHLGMKCFAGKKCKFSHAKISPQFRANLLRDSKECDFLQHMDSPPPKDDEARRERRERNRERHRDRGEHKSKDRKKGRDRRNSKDDRDNDRYTLHFKVDPRTISDEEEGQQTPMPSPSQDNASSDRETHTPEKESKKTNDLSPKSDIQLPDPKDSGIGEELPDFIPPDLPKHQRELYKRIQQQQREATNIEDEDEMEEREVVEEKEAEDFKDENWYSSEDEEDGGKVLGTVTEILNKLKQQPVKAPNPPITQHPAPPVIPAILPDIDINVVSKLLSTVRETIQQKQNSENLIKAAATISSATVVTTLVNSIPSVAPTVPSVSLNPLPPLTTLLGGESQPPAEKRRVRDPRLRGNSSEDDVDLRRQDVDLRQLPFKPAPIQPPASEIDASITAHPPITFQLIPLSPPPPPDYSHLSTKNVNDPRLKRYLPGGLVTAIAPPLLPTGICLSAPRPAPVALRDPRQARILPNDPRRKRADSDLRQQSFNHVDVDLRLHPSHLAFK